MRFAALALLAVLTACATSPDPAPGGGATREDVIVESYEAGRFNFELTREDRLVSTWLPAGAAELWQELLPSFAALGFEASQLSVFDPQHRHIAVQDQRVRRIAGNPVDRYLDCGFSPLARKSSNSDVRVSLTAWLEPTEDGTLMRIRFEGTSRDRGTTSSPTRCTSNGRLEEQLVRQVVARSMAARTGP